MSTQPERVESQEAARECLRAAGYRDYGQHPIHKNATLWARRVGDVQLCVDEWDWTAVQVHPQRVTYEAEARFPCAGGESASVKLYSFTPSELVERLPALEASLLAAFKALGGVPND